MIEKQDAFSAAGPVSLELYKKLLVALKPDGSFQEEVKKTSIHLVRASAFAGVQLRKQHLLLTIKAAKAIQSARIAKAEQASKNRWHMEVKLTTAGTLMLSYWAGCAMLTSCVADYVAVAG